MLVDYFSKVLCGRSSHFFRSFSSVLMRAAQSIISERSRGPAAFAASLMISLSAPYELVGGVTQVNHEGHEVAVVARVVRDVLALLRAEMRVRGRRAARGR